MLVMRTLLALLGVCALAWAVLALLARAGIGTGASARRGATRLQVLERLALSPRRQLYLVRADGRVLLLGASDGAALTLIAELAPDAAVPIAATVVLDERPEA
jgi:flagellar biogenesis protein FliO